MKDNFESCPRCGRLSRVMEGVFDFDADGIVTVLSAPQWSRAAIDLIQQPLLDAARALASPAYSDARADVFVTRKLDRLQADVDRLSQQNQEQTDQIRELIDELRKAQKKKPRSVLAKIMYGTWLAVGALATIGGAYGMLAGVFDWGFATFGPGSEPQLTDVPPSLLKPEPSPGPPPVAPE